MKIAISSKSGCGNTTVSQYVARRLGYKLVNYTFHSIATETGVSFEEICEMAEQDDKWDLQVDECQVKKAREGNTVLGSRLAIWKLDDADFRVYLDARLEVRAERIQRREGGDLQQIAERTMRRDQRDHDRYQRLYGIDNNKFQFVDLVVDTEDKTPEQIAELIIESAGATPTDS